MFWGRETGLTTIGPTQGNLDQPLAAVEMGLIYVNPTWRRTRSRRLRQDVRETFARMGMSGKNRGTGGRRTHLRPYVPPPSPRTEPEGACMHRALVGTTFHSGKAEHTITTALKGLETTRWDQGYFEMMFSYDWELTKSPAGAWQWVAKDVKPEHMIPDAHVPGQSSAPIMTTADLSLRHDSIMEPVARRFHQDQDAFADAFARAWFKLTHRDLGPRALYLGPEIPGEVQTWQDPIPSVDHPLIDDDDIANLKQQLLATGLGVPALVSAAWASASTFRGSDRRGGANGGRLRLLPQRSWEVNDPEQLQAVLKAIEAVQQQFNAAATGGKQVSIADLIVLAGCAAVEKAAADGGHSITVPFRPGRTDASTEQTDTASFNTLKPLADGFRNWQRQGLPIRAEELLLDKAQLLTLSAPEMTVLVAGLRVLGANSGDNRQGVFTDRIGVLSNDFCMNLLDMTTHGTPTSESQDSYVGRDEANGAERWIASRADLVFGSNSQLRAIVEVYAQSDGAARFIADLCRPGPRGWSWIASI